MQMWHLFSLMWIAQPRQQEKRQLEGSHDSPNSLFLPANMTVFQKEKKEKEKKEECGFASVTNTQKNANLVWVLF